MTAADWQALAAVRYASAREWYATGLETSCLRDDCAWCAMSSKMTTDRQRSAAEASVQARKLVGVE